MSRKTVVAIEDDLTGGPADETVRFSLDGADYEIDLSAQNAEKLRAELDLYVAAGRRVRHHALPSKVPSPRMDTAQLSAIREWARNQGLKVSPRGRIPEAVMQKYNGQVLRP